MTAWTAPELTERNERTERTDLTERTERAQALVRRQVVLTALALALILSALAMMRWAGTQTTPHVVRVARDGRAQVHVASHGPTAAVVRLASPSSPCAPSSPWWRWATRRG
jgi:type IV secretory pathway TrbF-like protein